MEVTFERELNETWIILTGETEAREEDCRLLERTPCRHLLRLSRREEMEGIRYAFAISRGNSLARMFQLKPMSFSELRKLLLGISAAVEEAEDCLLQPDQLVLLPELIFGMPDMDHLKLCCHPAFRKDFFAQLRELIRYCLRKIDHGDTRGTETAYELFGICEQEYYRFEDLMAVIGTAYAEEQEGSLPDPLEATGSEALRRKEEEPFSSPEEPSGFRLPPWIWAVPAALLFLLSAGAAALGVVVHRRAGVWVWRPFAAALLLFCGAALCGWRGLRFLRGSIRRNREAPGGGGSGEKTAEQTAGSAGKRSPFPGTEPEEPLSPATEFLGETTLLTDTADGELHQLVPLRSGRGEAALLRHFPFVIGKLAGEVDLKLDLPEISRVHARLERDPGGFRILDCRSTNGTWVNGVRLVPETPYPLQPGDELRFADVKYRFD